MKNEGMKNELKILADKWEKIAIMEYNEKHVKNIVSEKEVK